MEYSQVAKEAFCRCPAVYGILKLEIEEYKLKKLEEENTPEPAMPSGPIEWANKIRGIASRLAMGTKPEIDMNTLDWACEKADEVMDLQKFLNKKAIYI